jgi:endonuclease YncB( thermonuclease family)
VSLLCPSDAAPVCRGYVSESRPICGRGKRITCIVGGDTFWLDGIKYRLQGVNTPESGDKAHCPKERQWADAATARLQQLMQMPGLRKVQITSSLIAAE